MSAWKRSVRAPMRLLVRNVVLVLALVCTLAGCAAYRKCGFGGCPGDADVTSQVRALLAQHPSLVSSNAIDVQTWDHVVYLYGLVDTDMERQLLESVAGRANGATRIVNLVGIRNGGR